jgi:hypothetical protein
VPLARFTLAQLLSPEGASAARLTAGLPDVPVSFALFSTGREAGLHVRVPSQVPAALFKLYNRLLNAHLALDALLFGPSPRQNGYGRTGGSPHPADAPAPPAPPPAP